VEIVTWHLSGNCSGIYNERRHSTVSVEVSLDQHASWFGLRNRGSEALLSSEGAHIEADDGSGSDSSFFHGQIAELRGEDARMFVTVICKDRVRALRWRWDVGRGRDQMLSVGCHLPLR
jgi:hypothetical protein